jgi:DNA-binding FadR family transcriptional regulator
MIELAAEPPDNAASRLRPIQPQKLYVIAANQLVAQIKSGVLPPGSRLPGERELSGMLGISRASVRQALSTLEAIGVLSSKRGVGHFVKEGAALTAGPEVVDSLMSQGDPQELLEARRIFEPEVARLAATYRDSDDLAGMYDLIDRMRIAEEQANFTSYLDVDFIFHLTLAYATHNPVIADMARVIVERMKAPPWKAATYTILPNTLAVNRDEHSQILAAVAARRSKEAHQAMISHLATIARNLRNISVFADLGKSNE